jgi:hypothetical protein
VSAHDQDSAELEQRQAEDDWAAHVAACELPIAACEQCGAWFGLERVS